MNYTYTVFRKQKSRKASGPDGISPACLKVCVDQLAPIFTQIFNRSLERCEVPRCFKCSTIIPIPQKPQITGLNDYWPVALTSVVMKFLERLVLAYLKDITGPLLDPHKKIKIQTCTHTQYQTMSGATALLLQTNQNHWVRNRPYKTLTSTPHTHIDVKTPSIHVSNCTVRRKTVCEGRNIRAKVALFPW